jgi:hypothetical protein
MLDLHTSTRQNYNKVSFSGADAVRAIPTSRTGGKDRKLV